MKLWRRSPCACYENTVVASPTTREHPRSDFLTRSAYAPPRGRIGLKSHSYSLQYLRNFYFPQLNDSLYDPKDIERTTKNNETKTKNTGTTGRGPVRRVHRYDSAG